MRKNTLFYFIKKLKCYTKEILILTITLIMSTLAIFLQPLMIKQITDIGMVEKNMNAIIVGTVGLSICAFSYLIIQVIKLNFLQNCIILIIKNFIIMHF